MKKPVSRRIYSPGQQAQGDYVGQKHEEGGDVGEGDDHRERDKARGHRQRGEEQSVYPRRPAPAQELHAPFAVKRPADNGGKGEERHGGRLFTMSTLQIIYILIRIPLKSG